MLCRMRSADPGENADPLMTIILEEIAGEA